MYLDKHNRVLYVGKAKDLKARVSSYFTNTTQLGIKTKLLVSQIARIKTTLVESEIEALLLEAFYIKKYNPKYNVRLTDNKAYVLIQITLKDDYPKILFARQATDPTSVYFGPFPSSSSVKLVLKTIRRAFPYQAVRNHPKRICLYNHIGLCPCPPVNDSPELKKMYRKNIKHIIEIFEGSSKKIMKQLERERDKLSKDEQFEEALSLQRRINALSYITQPMHKPYEYAVNPNLRSDKRQEELDTLQKILQQNGCPVTTLSKIECFDISNIQGTNAVGSMVVFVNGEKESSKYRKFKIRQENKPNDFAMMEEVLTRRLKHTEWEYPGLLIVDGGKGQVSSALKVLQSNNLQIPLIGLAKREETIVIPLNRHAELVSASHQEFNGIPKQVRDDKFIEVSLPKESSSLHLIQRIRDEAHRFAITYHRKLRSKAFIEK